MSRKVSDKEYKKTFSYKFSKWFYGSEEPYLNQLEMKPQKEFKKIDDITAIKIEL